VIHAFADADQKDARLVRLAPEAVDRFLSQMKGFGVPISKSAINKYLACPARWALGAIERQPPDHISEELRLGQGCHAAIAELLQGDLLKDETAVALRLGQLGVAHHHLPSATGWVLWAASFGCQRWGAITAVEKYVSSGAVPAIWLRGRFDLVITGGAGGALELVDWTLGRRPRYVSAQQLRMALGTAIHRTLLAVDIPDHPEEVVISELWVPGRQVISVELNREDVARAWAEIRSVSDGMRAVADSGLVRADPGHHCGWCPYRQRCPEAAAPEDAS